MPVIIYSFIRRPLFDGPEGDFQVNVVTHITFLTHDKFPSAPEGEVLIRNNFSSGFASVRVCDHIDKRLDKHKIGEGLTSESFLVNMTLIASSKNIHLWWPNGAGEQILYALEVCYQDKKKKTFSHWVMNRVGEFDTVYLW